MKTVRIARTGGPEVLELAEAPKPRPGAAEILVRQEAVGLNFIDTYQRSGLYPLDQPAVLGSEGAGVVEAVGEAVTRFRPGDRAAYAAGRAAYAEFCLAREDQAVRLPATISARTAAGTMMKGLTAEMLVRRCYPLRAGETCLVWAAAGGVGSILVQWAKSIGAEVIGCIGSETKVRTARALGCDHVILYKTEDVAARVRKITGGAGVRVVYDGVGKVSFDASLNSLGRRGMLVSYGNASGPVAPVAPLALARAGSLYLTRPMVFDYLTTAAELDDAADALFAMIESGAVQVAVGLELPLAQARQAHEAIESGATTGSILLIP